MSYPPYPSQGQNPPYSANPPYQPPAGQYGYPQHSQHPLTPQHPGQVPDYYAPPPPGPPYVPHQPPHQPSHQPPHQQHQPQYPQYAPPPGPPPFQPGAPHQLGVPPPPGAPYQAGAPYQQGVPPQPNHGYQPPPYGQQPPASPVYWQQQGDYQQPYGHSGAYYPPTPPSLGYGPPQNINWDAAPTAEACRAAMKGLGTDEKSLIRALVDKDPLQIRQLNIAFGQRYQGRNLIKDVESETGGDFRYGLTMLLRGPLLADVYSVYMAIEGAGTDEEMLNDVVLCRSNADLQAIKDTYRKVFHRNIEDEIAGDLSMKTKQHFRIVLGANRAEDSAPVNLQDTERDVESLYKATEGRVGTEEITVCSIFSTRNDAQIRAINDLYYKRYSRELESVIEKEFSGHMEDALLFQLRHAIDPIKHAARLLEDAMAGVGTREKLLARRVVRFHWDRNAMQHIRDRYYVLYKRDLADRIKKETSGDFRRFLVACLGDEI